MMMNNDNNEIKNVLQNMYNTRCNTIREKILKSKNIKL